jgi:hypothetical protein
VALASDDISRLHARHAEELLGYFARRTLQAEVAVDLVGETFALAFADRAQFRAGVQEELIFDAATAEIIGERYVVVSRSFGRVGLILEDYSYLRRAVTSNTLPPPATKH